MIKVYDMNFIFVLIRYLEKIKSWDKSILTILNVIAHEQQRKRYHQDDTAETIFLISIWTKEPYFNFKYTTRKCKNTDRIF